MNNLDKELAVLGNFIDKTRCRLDITKDLLCAEIKCSKSTYQKV